jgi:phenylpropionate dioxygenase-like ring-hydroxylating dioxygenase large terminal subunit
MTVSFTMSAGGRPNRPAAAGDAPGLARTGGRGGAHPLATLGTGPLAPVDQSALARALQPFGRSTVLPAAAYTDPEMHAWERRNAFAAGWVCLGRADELVPAGASQQALTVGDVPVLLTRVDGELRAWANTCPHRGHELLRDGCTASSRSMVCPYHAWSFGLDGRLVGAPRMRNVAGFDPRRFELVSVPLRIWHGFAMVNATGTAAPLPAYLGAIEPLVAPYGCGSLRLGARNEYTVAANWKVIAENYHECYHCPLIHPELCRVTPPDSGENYDLPGAWVGGAMDLREGMATMSLDGGSGGVPIPGVDPRRVLYLGLFPNLLLSLHPDYVMAHRLVSLAADRTFVECSWYFPEPAFERPGFSPAYAVQFWDVTNREDWAACESVQRGLSSPHYRPGPLSPGEDAVHQWVSMVGRLYRGTAPHL